MSQSSNKEFAMAVGTSSMLEPNMMEGENFYTPMETSTQPEPEPEPEQATQNNWSNVKNDTGQLCRACANTSDYLIPIFEGEGLEHQLETKITKHLPIQVTATDTLPLQLCYQCASTLIAWDTMINSCIEADKKLRAMQEAAGEEIKDTDDFDSSHIDNDTIDSDDEPLITSKAKLAEKKKVPIKKKILSKAKSKNLTVKNDKTASDSKEGEEKERYKSRDNHYASDNDYNYGGLDESLKTVVEDETLTYGETQVNLIKANIFKKRSVNTPFKRWVKCVHCLSMFSTKASLARHLKRSNCKEDANKLDTLSHLSLSEIKEAIYGSKLKKKREEKNAVPVIKLQPETKPEEKAFGCQRCDAKFAHQEGLKRHVETHARKLHLCPICGKQFSYRSSLVAHQSLHENLAKCHACTRCDAAFTTLRSLRRHYYTHYSYRDKEFICEFCGKRFAYSMTLKNHMFSHSEERPHVCRMCDTSFKRLSHLRTHEQGVHGLQDKTQAKRYTCAICQKAMVRKESLEAHMKEHTGELNYKCTNCHKKFATNTGLNIHVAMARCDHYVKSCSVCHVEFKADEAICEHLKAKPASRRKPKSRDKGVKEKKEKVPRNLKERNFFCSVCGKNFIYGCELKTHFRLAHTDEKPFVCGLCGKAFKAKASLRMHEDVHNDHRPHQCNICEKRFRKTDHLKLHVRTHTGEKPHVCEVCGRGFVQKGDMKKHLLKTHDKTLPSGKVAAIAFSAAST